MIDIAQLCQDPDFVKTQLARRGVSGSMMDEIIALDSEHRLRLQEAEALRAQVKELSRQVGEANKAGKKEEAETLRLRSRELGDQESAASELAAESNERLRAKLLLVPNLPDPRVPEG